MALLPEDSSLKQINEIFNREIPQYRILGDLPLDYHDFIQLANRIGIFYERAANQQIFLWYKESLAVFLVFCAIYEYDDRTFWKPIEKYIGEVSIYHRNEMFQVFLKVLYKYDLERFKSESEEGFSQVTPILCHAGIPINALDSFFLAVGNTIGDSFYDDFSVNDYLSYFKNKTEITVRRYLKLNGYELAYQFIQDVRKAIIGTAEEDIKLTGNELRMLTRMAEWKEKPKIRKNLNARQNVRITAPRMKIDIDGAGVFFELPQIMLKQSYEAYVYWEIQSDDKTDMVKASIYRWNQIFYSEEKQFTIKPAGSYVVTLKVEENVISKWEFKGVRDSYIAFHMSGSVIKNDGLPDGMVVLLLKSTEDISNRESLMITELPTVPFWHLYSTYRLDLSNEKELVCSSIIINIIADKNPILQGGEKLFSQINTDSYTKLPYFKMPKSNENEWHFEVQKKHDGSVIDKYSIALTAIGGQIGLEQIIKADEYGGYQIKIWHNSGVNTRVYIEYVPAGKWIGQKEYWPSEFSGYPNPIQALQIDTTAEMSAYNAELVNCISNSNYATVYFKVQKNERFLIGEYRYRIGNYAYTTFVKKNLYPLSWGIASVNNELIELVSPVYSFTLNELQKISDPMLYLAFDISKRENPQTLILSLCNHGYGRVIYEEFYIKDKTSLRISLNKWVMELQGLSEINHLLSIEIRDTQDMPLTAFSIARIQEEVIISNVQCVIQQEEIVLKWDEEGTKINRECVLVNFTHPWTEPVYKSIKDGEANLKFSVSDLSVGIYKYVIRKRAVDLFSDEQENEWCRIKRKDILSGYFRVGERAGEVNVTNKTDIKHFLVNLLRTRFIKIDCVEKKINELAGQLGTIGTIAFEDVEALTFAYIVYVRFYGKRNGYKKIDDCFEILFHKFAVYQLAVYHDEIVKFILESKLNTKYKRMIFNKFYCNNLLSVKKINDIQKNVMVDIDEELAGFLFLINGHSRGYSWAGVSDISVLRVEDLFGSNEKTFLTKENMGSSAYILQYFDFVYKIMQRPKNIYKKVEEFIREFQN